MCGAHLFSSIAKDTKHSIRIEMQFNQAITIWNERRRNIKRKNVNQKQRWRAQLSVFRFGRLSHVPQIPYEIMCVFFLSVSSHLQVNKSFFGLIDRLNYKHKLLFVCMCVFDQAYNRASCLRDNIHARAAPQNLMYLLYSLRFSFVRSLRQLLTLSSHIIFGGSTQFISFSFRSTTGFRLCVTSALNILSDFVKPNEYCSVWSQRYSTAYHHFHMRMR